MTEPHDGAEPTPEGADMGPEAPELTPEQERAVTELLAGVPAEPMPQDVADRIQQALHDEAADRAAGEPSPTVVPAAAAAVPSQRSRRGRILEVAAGVALVGGAVLIGVNVLGDSDSELSATQDGAATVQVVSSGTAYTESGFEAELAVLVPTVSRTTTEQGAAAPADGSAPEPIPVVSDSYVSSPYSLPVAALDECLRALNPEASPEVVDAATYDTQPALVVVYTAVAGDWEVFAVGVDCSAEDERLLRYLRIQD